MGKQEQKAELEAWAREVQSVLLAENAIRNEDGDIESFVTVDEIFSRCSFHPDMWMAVRNKMYSLKIRLALYPGRGYYIGHEGEQATGLVYALKQASTRKENVQENLLSLSIAGELEMVYDYATGQLSFSFMEAAQNLGAFMIPMPLQMGPKQLQDA